MLVKYQKQKMCACKHVKVSIYVEGFFWGGSNCVAIIEYSFYILFFSCYFVFSMVLTLTKRKIIWSL